MDSRFREQAKAENCYIRVRGAFLPCPSSTAGRQGDETRRTFADALVFLKSRKDKSGWIQLTEGVMESLQTDSEAAHSYVCGLLSGDCKRQNKKTDR